MARSFDLRIRGATIVDGLGGARFVGDVGIVGDRIAEVGRFEGESTETISADGLVCSPGFIDPHSHADLTILTHPQAENLLAQGVTTFVGGNCGFSPAPSTDPDVTQREISVLGADLDVRWRTFGEWLSHVEQANIAVNYAPLVGHGAVRMSVMGSGFHRAARTREVEEMAHHLREAMASGAFGLAAGMDYHSEYADVESETVPMLKIVADCGGLYAVHTRNVDFNWPVEDPGDYRPGRSHRYAEDAWIGRYHGLLEAVETARRVGNIPLHIAHFTSGYNIFQPHPDYLEEAAARATLEVVIDAPNQAGQRVTFDVIPYTGSVGSQSLLIDSFLPPQVRGPRAWVPEWLESLGRSEFIEQLKRREFRDRLHALIFSGRFRFGMTVPRTDAYWIDCFRVLQCANPRYEGKTIGEIARARSPHYIRDAVFRESVEALLDMLVDDPETVWAAVLDKRLNPVAVETFLRHPASMPCIDGPSLPLASPGDGSVMMPPVYYGLFPHYLSTYVRSLGVLTLGQAVHKATVKPSETFGIRDRGSIRPGAYADIVLFDAERIGASGDMLHPNRPPDGIEAVLVNGQVAYRDRSFTGVRSGRVLRRAG